MGKAAACRMIMRAHEQHFNFVVRAFKFEEGLRNAGTSGLSLSSFIAQRSTGHIDTCCCKNTSAGRGAACSEVCLFFITRSPLQVAPSLLLTNLLLNACLGVHEPTCRRCLVMLEQPLLVSADRKSRGSEGGGAERHAFFKGVLRTAWRRCTVVDYSGGGRRHALAENEKMKS